MTSLAGIFFPKAPNRREFIYSSIRRDLKLQFIFVRPRHEQLLNPLDFIFAHIRSLVKQAEHGQHGALLIFGAEISHTLLISACQAGQIHHLLCNQHRDRTREKRTIPHPLEYFL